MSEFKPITSQEEFESKLTERLAQKERAVKKQFDGFLSKDDVEKLKNEYETKIASLSSDNDEKYKNYIAPDELAKIKNEYETKIAKYESDSVKTKIAIETGLPLELRNRLKGSTEEEIREDAKTLCGFTTKKRNSHLATSEVSKEGNDGYFRKLLKELEKEN